MKILYRFLIVFPVLAGLLGASSASADYPPSGDTGSTPNLPETGSTMVQDASTFGGLTIVVGIALIVAMFAYRRSATSL